MRKLMSVVVLLLLCLDATAGFAAGGPIGIDHEWSLDQSGIWSRPTQISLEYAVVGIEAGSALWLGNDNKLGHTFWQAIDSTAISSASAAALKLAFSRSRPKQQHDPDKWFQGSGNESFPSGEVTLQASFVTPFIVNYSKDHPWVWSLELLPLYDSIARMKSQAHWQTDVIAGWLLGTAIGYWSTTRNTPISVQVLPDGLSVGISRRF